MSHKIITDCIDSFKYNYVIFGSNWDLYKQTYQGLERKSCVQYIAGNYPKMNTFKGLLYKIHFSAIYNKVFRKAFRSIWNRFYFKSKFKDEKPICFMVVYSGWRPIFTEYGFERYLRKKYKRCKIVFFLHDLYKTIIPPSLNLAKVIENDKKIFDIILSYDKNDCTKYGLVYHHTVFSIENIQLNHSLKNIHDVFLIARVKKRFPVIIKLFEQLNSCGVDCDFYLLDVPKSDRIYQSKIHYIDELMSYSECLKKVYESKCVLEVMQDGAIGYTYRLWETIAMNKKLLTNNMSLIYDSEFYSKDYIRILKDTTILEDDIKFVKSDSLVDLSKYIEKLSPLNLLSFIDKML